MLRTKLLLSALLALIAAAALVPLVDSSRAEVEEEVRRRRRERAEQRPTTYGDTTREQILETRNRRKRQLTVMVMDARKKLADHSAGEKILAAEEKEQLENSVDLFQRKIESMEVELEEWVSSTAHTNTSAENDGFRNDDGVCMRRNNAAWNTKTRITSSNSSSSSSSSSSTFPPVDHRTKLHPASGAGYY